MNHSSSRITIIFMILAVVVSAFVAHPKSANALPPRPARYIVYLPIVQRTMPLQPKVFVVAYIADTKDISNPEQYITQLTTELISDLTRATTWHGYDPQSKSIPSLNYTLSISGIITLRENPPHTAAGQFDYAAVYNRFGLCDMVQRDQVDEVWIWEDGTGNALESVISGPVWSLTWDRVVPNCGRMIVTLNLNYRMSITFALHTYAHSIESIMQYSPFAEYETCDFLASFDWGASQPPGILWNPAKCYEDWSINEKNGFIARPSRRNGGVAICGDVHRPPNIVNDAEMYNYGSLISVPSRCMDWDWNGNSIQNIDCRVWQCEPCPKDDCRCNDRNAAKYFIWWMQNIPGLGNTSRGRDGALRSNWWALRFK